MSLASLKFLFRKERNRVGMKVDGKNILKILLAFFLIAFIVYNLRVKVLVKTLAEVNPSWLVLACLIFFLSHLIIVFRIKFVLSKFHRLSTGKIFWSHFFGYMMGQVTPGKLGYFFTAYPLKWEKVPYSLSSSILVFSQLISFFIQMILAGFCVFYLTSVVEASGIIYMILILGWVLNSIIITILFLKYGVWKFSRLIRKLPKGMKLLNFIESLNRDFSSIKRYSLPIFVLTLLCWVLRGLAWWAIGMSLNVDLPFYAFVLLNPLVSSLTFFPITPAGIGIAEAGNVLIFSYLGILPEKGFIFMLFDRSINLLTSLLGLKILLSRRTRVKAS